MTSDLPACPSCGRAMVLRTTRRGPRAGSQFYGCSTYPRCRGIRPVVELPIEAAQPAEPGGPESGRAGGSAQREYERRVAKRELTVKGRFGRRIGGAILALTDEPQSTRAWKRGAEGERQLAEGLEGLDGVRLLHDRSVPRTRGNIDHIVIGPAGVFVVDAKLYAGVIKVRDVGGLFRRDERLYVGRRDCSKLAANMAWQVAAVTTALLSVDPTPPITSVLCFVKGEWPLFGAPSSYAGVRLEGTRSLRKLIQNGQALDSDQITAVAQQIAVALPSKPGS